MDRPSSIEVVLSITHNADFVIFDFVLGSKSEKKIAGEDAADSRNRRKLMMSGGIRKGVLG